MSINFNVDSNSLENKSKVVLRTNPHLTSNVKLVVDSTGDLYLESFNANKTLSAEQYKKFSIDHSGRYSFDLLNFYKDTPLENVYDVWRVNSDNSVYREYERQYEEQYQYGARLNDSKLYENNIRFLAPIWLEDDLPEYFVIYRVDEPVASGSLSDAEAYTSTTNDRIMHILKNATLVASFDMTKDSKIGKYLTTHIEDPLFPYSAMTVSFEKDEKTVWNGIDLVKGGFTSKGEYLQNEIVSKDRLEILSNQFLTEGFKRNKLVSANLINLEFIFDDPNVQPYDVNRYIGFYVKAHKEGQFKTLGYRKESLKIDTSSVSTEYDLTGTGLNAIDMLPNSDLSLPVLQWVKNRGQFYNVLNTFTPGYELKVSAMEDAILGGYIEKKETLQVDNIVPSLKDFLKIEVVGTPLNSETWIVASKTEWDSNGDPYAFTLIADDSLLAGKANGQRFSTQGKLEQIAFALTTAINNIEDNPFKVTNKGTLVWIEHNSIGNRLHRSFFAERNTNTSNSIQVKIGEQDNVTQYLALAPSVYTDWNVYYPIGGSSAGIGFIVKEEEIGDIDTNTFIKTRDDRYHRIIDVVEDPYNEGKYRVCLNGNKLNPSLIFDTSFNLYVESLVEWGKFEAFDFIDFDFDFYSTANSEPKELQYEDLDPVDTVGSPLLSGHFINPSNMSVQWQDYYKQLEGIPTQITPTTSGVSQIYSEYDRLQENYVKETSTLSRVVPFINKWSYKNSVNCKEKPYFLTTSEAFGKTNFAPNLEVSGRNSKAMTHEWYYIYKYPKYSSVSQTPAGMGNIVRSFYSYIQPDETIDIDVSSFTSVTENWFDRLFVYEGINVDNTWVPVKPQKKYSTFIKGSTLAPSETMFRGLKVKAYSRKEFTELNPRNLITSTEFNDYKFSAILNYNYQSTEELTYRFIQNKKWKTLTLYIELNTSEELLSYVNRKTLYELNHFLNSLGQPVTSSVGGYLAFNTSYAPANVLIVDGINTSLLKDVQLDQNGGYGTLTFEFYGYTFEIQVLDVFSDNKIKLQVLNSLGQIQDVTSSITLTLPSLTPLQCENIQMQYTAGGYNLATSSFERIGIQYLTELINSNDTERIQYITVEEDGTQLMNRFIINIEDGNSIIKSSSVRVEADSFKPKSYKVSSTIIGYSNTTLKKPVNVELIRLNGEYQPTYREVVTFTDIYKSHKLERVLSTTELKRQERIYAKFNRLGIAFASYDNFGIDGYGLIKNYFYHKVNPEKADGILKLSQSGDAAPVYPLINEVAIDRRNQNVFRSSWEDEFYVKNGTQVQKELVFGTLSAYEESSFLASTLNLPKDAYNITSYSGINYVTDFQALKSIKTSGNYKGDVLIYEDDTNIWIDFYLKTNLINLLVNDNAGLSIKKYVNVSQSYGDKTTLDDDIKTYVEVNLLKLMGIEEIRVWNKPSKSITSSQILSASSVQDILDSSFEEEKNFRIERDPNQPLNVRLIYNKRPGFKHQFYVYVKISS